MVLNLYIRLILIINQMIIIFILLLHLKTCIIKHLFSVFDQRRLWLYCNVWLILKISEKPYRDMNADDARSISASVSNIQHK